MREREKGGGGLYLANRAKGKKRKGKKK